MEEKDIDNGLIWLDRQLGRRYDYSALIGIFIRALMRKLGLNKGPFKNFLESKIRFYCAELVETYAEKTGERLWHGPISYVTPYDLYRSRKITRVL